MTAPVLQRAKKIPASPRRILVQQLHRAQSGTGELARIDSKGKLVIRSPFIKSMWIAMTSTFCKQLLFDLQRKLVDLRGVCVTPNFVRSDAWRTAMRATANKHCRPGSGTTTTRQATGEQFDCQALRFWQLYCCPRSRRKFRTHFPFARIGEIDSCNFQNGGLRCGTDHMPGYGYRV